MEKSDESRRYKWSYPATNLLVSIWCHDLMQNQFKISPRNQPIWESIARYMTRKGYHVSGLQCKTRIKNMICSYHEAVKKNDSRGIEPYYDIFKKVLCNKKVKKKRRDSKSKINQNECKIDTDENIEGSIYSNLVDTNQNNSDSDYQPEFLEICNRNAQFPSSFCIKELGDLITKAIDIQTKSVTNALKKQSQTIEKLLISEREKLEKMMASEKEFRQQLEMKLDTILSRLETYALPKIMCYENLINAKNE